MTVTKSNNQVNKAKSQPKGEIKNNTKKAQPEQSTYKVYELCNIKISDPSSPVARLFAASAVRYSRS
jgi:hypothetical protein